MKAVGKLHERTKKKKRIFDLQKTVTISGVKFIISILYCPFRIHRQCAITTLCARFYYMKRPRAVGTIVLYILS